MWFVDFVHVVVAMPKTMRKHVLWLLPSGCCRCRLFMLGLCLSDSCHTHSRNFFLLYSFVVNFLRAPLAPAKRLIYRNLYITNPAYGNNAAGKLLQKCYFVRWLLPCTPVVVVVSIVLYVMSSSSSSSSFCCVFSLTVSELRFKYKYSSAPQTHSQG